MKLFYCSFKRHFKDGSDYYTNGSFPDFLPELSKNFKKVYLMVPVANYISKGMSKLCLNEKIIIVPTKLYHHKYLKYIQPYLWSFSLVNIRKFRLYQKAADVVLIAVPSSISCLTYIICLDKPLVTLIAGDEQEVVKASNSIFSKVEYITGILKLRELIEKNLTKRSSAIICRNELFKRKLIKKYKIPESKIHIVPAYVKGECFTPLPLNEKTKIRSKLGLKENDIVIGFAATSISYQKGADILLAAFSMLKKDYSNVKLILIGEDNIGIPYDKDILHCGLIKKEILSDYYNSMDIFVLPTLSESFGKVLCEAALCEVPLISTNVGGVSQIIKHGENGFLVDAQNVNKIVEYCKIIIEDKELRKNMGKRAREHVINNFDFYKLVDITADIIKKVPKRKEN